MIFEKMQLEEDEKIRVIVRRHWFYLLVQVLSVATIVITPLLGFLFVTTILQDIFTFPLADYLPHLLFMYAFWLLCNWMLLASIWTDHYLDVWVITNKRIININQVGLFKRQIGTFRLERLQDINVEINGIIETFLDFGTIHAETASGGREEFKATYLPHPRELKSLILQGAESEKGSANL